MSLAGRRPTSACPAGCRSPPTCLPSLRTGGKKNPLEIRSQADCYDFWLVQMVFTLAVERGYTLDWMELGVKLTHPGRVPSTAVVASRPCSRDPFRTKPRSTADCLRPVPAAHSGQGGRRKKVDGRTALEFEKVKVGLGEAGLTVKHTEPVPTVVGYNKRQPDPYWRFDKGRSRGVEPGIKEMKLIVRSHRNRPTRGRCGSMGTGGGSC